MKGFYDNIEKLTVENENFRKVLYTTKGMQLVLMSLKPNEDIGEEVHNEHDQFFRFEAGEGKVVLDDNIYEVKDGDSVIVPAGSNHNIINTSSSESLKLYTIYSPAHHKDQLIHITKQDAEENDLDFDGTTTE